MDARGSVLGRALGKALRGVAVTASVLTAAAYVASTLRAHDAQTSRQVAADDDDAGIRVATPRAALQPSGPLRLDRESQEQGGITAVERRRTTYRRTVHAFGVVLGVDKLTVLYNEALSQAMQLRLAEAKAAAARVANGRAQDLVKVFPTAKAQAEAASAALATDTIAVDAVQTQAQTLRNTAVDQWGPVLGEAVISRAGLVGDLVLRKTCLVQVSFASDAPAKPPREIVLPVRDGATVTGRYVSEAPQVDPRIQSIGFLYVAPAAPGLLPGRSIAADVTLGEMASGIDVPSSAVVWEAGRPWVYLRVAPDTFERHSIEEGSPTPDGGYVVPSRRLSEKGALVTAGAQVLLSQELRARIPSDEDDN